MLIFVLSLCIACLISLGTVLLPRWFGIGSRATGLRNRRLAIIKMTNRLSQRVAKRKRDLTTASGSAARLEVRKRELLHDRKMTEVLAGAAVRLIEADYPRRDTQIWLVRVINRQADAMTPRPGVLFHFDKSWARPQTILVSAPGIEEARELTERSFAAPLGFYIVSVEKAPKHLASLLAAPDAENRGDPKAAA